jgi:membrane-associated phospholipid phosphatase
MRLSNWAAFLIAALAVTPAAAQPSSGDGESPSASTRSPGPLDESTAGLLAGTGADALFRPARAPRGSFFRDVGGDFKRFFSSDETLWTVGAMGAGALLASSWDGSSARAIHEDWSDEAFAPGDLAGNILTHLALGGGSYLVGRVSGHDGVARLGTDLIRAQLLAQAVTQAAKFATNRDRPDGSNDHSLPSGHTAAAFATAGVVQRHYGWKAGIPAYAVASYIGASRMATNRHYLSDVLLGAGIGIAAAHTVTIDVGAEKFDLGVAPTIGGATLTFTRR